LENGVSVVAHLVKERQDRNLLYFDDEFLVEPQGFVQRNTLSSSEDERHQANQTLTALYEPRNPSRSILYAFSDYEVVPRV
jgi:hypothetical protein